MTSEPRIRLYEPAVIFAVYYSSKMEKDESLELTTRLCNVLLNSIGDRSLEVRNGFIDKRKDDSGMELSPYRTHQSRTTLSDVQDYCRTLKLPNEYEHANMYLRAGTQFYLQIQGLIENHYDWAGSVPPAAFLTLMATEPPKIKHKDGMIGLCRDFFFAAEMPNVASGYAFCDTLRETWYHDMFAADGAALSWEREINLQDWNSSDDSRFMRVRCPAWATFLGPALSRKVDPDRTLVNRFLELDTNGARSETPGTAEYLPSGSTLFITSSSHLQMIREPEDQEMGGRLRSTITGVNAAWLWQQFRRANAI